MQKEKTKSEKLAKCASSAKGLEVRVKLAKKEKNKSNNNSEIKANSN